MRNFLYGLALAIVLTAGSATALSPYLPFQGGTGISTAPSYGQLLMGNGSGVYTLVSTSSLGISTSGASTTLLSDKNNWSALQTFSNSSTTLGSFSYASSTKLYTGQLYVGPPANRAYLYSNAYGIFFDGDATTTINANSDGSGSETLELTNSGTVGLSLDIAGLVTIPKASSTLFSSSYASTTSLFLGTGQGALYTGSGAKVSMVATSTPTVTAPITYSGTLGSFLGGSSGAFDCTTANASTKGCIAAADFSKFNSATTTFSWPLIYTLGTNAVTWGGLSTTSQPASSNILVSNGTNGIYGVATTTASCTGSASCTPFTVIGSSPVTITATGGSGGGLATTTTWNPGQLATVVDNGTVTGVSTSTLTAGTGLSGSFTQLGSGGSLSLNTANANTWSALQTFSYASTTGISGLYSSSTRAYAGTLNVTKTANFGTLAQIYENAFGTFFDSTGTTTISANADGSGTEKLVLSNNGIDALTADIFGRIVMTNASTSLFSTSYASSTKAYFGNASSTLFSASYASSTVWRGGGLTTDCDTALTSKLLWDATTGQFSCGTDQTGGGSSFAYPFPGNATTTEISFNGGLVIKDSGAALAFDTANRQLYDGSELVTVKYGSRLLTNSSGNDVADWETTTLSDTSGGASVLWANRQLADSTAATSIDWGSRILTDAGANTSLTWDNWTVLKLPGYDCSGNVGGGLLTVNAAHEIVCADDLSGGGGSSFGQAWEIFGDTYLAPTTTLGVFVSASSTIGNGTQAGGLTINGGSTTTMTAFFNGSVGVGRNDPMAKIDAMSATTSLVSLYAIESPFFHAGTFTNFLLQTEAFATTWVRLNGPAVTSNSASDPLGNATAELLGVGTDAYAGVTQNVTNSTTGDWTFSVYLKGLATTTVALELSYGNGSATTTATTTYNVYPQYRRYANTVNIPSAHTYKTVRIINGTTNVAAWGAMLDNFGYARPYLSNNTTAGVTTATTRLYTPAAIVTASTLTISGALSGVTTIANSSTHTTTMTSLGTTTLATADGLYLRNSTAATAGLNAQQAPRIRFGSTVWDGAASQAVDWLISTFPRISGTGTTTLDFSAAYAGKGTSTVMSLTPFGNVGIGTSTPWGLLSVNANYGTNNALLFNVASSTATATTSLFSISKNGTITVTASQPATSTTIALDWANTPPQIEYQIGTSATTITIINATTSYQWGSRKLVWVCNPGATAGALTWAGVEWIGTAPTQTTTSNQCDAYSFDITRATSTTAYKVAGSQGAGFQ